LVGDPARGGNVPGMYPLRLAILVAFFGSTLWAFSLYLPIRLGWAPEDASQFVAETRKAIEDERKSEGPIDWSNSKKLEADTRFWKAYNAQENQLAEGLILGAALRKEVVIVTLTGVTWILAGLVKARAT